MTITETENKDDKFLKFLLENKRPSPWSFCEESRTTGDPRWTFGSHIMGTYLMDNKDFKKLNTLRLTYLADREELLMYLM